MSNSVKDYRVNGRPVSEFDLAILLAGQFGLPAPFLAGEMRACQQAREIVPHMVTVQTKEGLSDLSALHLAPSEARRLIRERSAEAVERANAGEFAPVVWPGPYRLEIQMRAESYKPEQAGPGMEFVNRHTMAWHARDFASVFEFATYSRVPQGQAFLTPRDWRRSFRGRKG